MPYAIFAWHTSPPLHQHTLYRHMEQVHLSEHLYFMI